MTAALKAQHERDRTSRVLPAHSQKLLHHWRGIGHQYFDRAGAHQNFGGIAWPQGHRFGQPLQGLMATATALATMGIGTVGTRQIAEALSQEDERALAVVRRALFWGTLLLAGAGALVVWSLREVLAVNVLGGQSMRP